ncbi:Ig-like domain-containing protein, partial [Emticicia aquatilis]|uniref:Ig-like domain-containing protein n=1 Tax=Emticicia aquatilis TaxID=1537369 RepID=UPI001E57F988
MKKSFLCFFFLFIGFASFAQCPFNNSPTFGGTANNDASNLVLGTRSILYESMWAGDYYEINNIQAGAKYRFDFCDATYDTYMTLFPKNSTTQIAFNDNFCGTGGTRSQIEYTFPTGGSYRIQLNEKLGGNNCTSNGTNTPLYVTLISAPQVESSVSSITNVSASTTNATSISFTVTFSAAITGLTSSNFSLSTTGVSGASISSVSGSGTTWTVVVNSGTGNGTIKLNLLNDTGLTPALSNEPFTTGATYTIDKSPPTLTITSTASNPTKNSPIPVTFTFNEIVTGFVDTDVSVTNGVLGSFSGSGLIYTAAITPNSNGAVGVDVIGNRYADLAGNSNTNSSIFSIQFDNIPPTVSSIVRNNPTSQNTNAPSVVFGVSFSETVTGVDVSDFSLATTGNVSGNIANVTFQSSIYLVTVNNISGAGTLKLNLNGSGTGITDIATNAINAGFTSGEIYSFGNAPSFVLASPQILTVCQNSSAIAINNLLAVTDIDNGQTLTWSIQSSPQKGVLTGFPFSSITNGGSISPTGLTYTPNNNQTGSDSFTIRVSDGTNTVDMVVNVGITSLPSITINQPLTVCAGNAINLTSSVGNSYSWSGPNSFSSSLQNPIISNASSLNTGTYSLVVATNGCSASATTSVTVNPLPNITINQPLTVCAGNAINLTSSVGDSYLWSGPNGFSSSLQNPIISNASSSNTGTYSLVVATNGCSASATTSVTVNPLPNITIN